MDLELTAAERAFQAEVRDWLAGNVPAEPLPSMDTEAGFEAHRRWEAKLYSARLSVVDWPEAYGGRGASLIEWLLFEEEYYRAGAPGRVSQNGIFLLGPTLLRFGTEAQRARVLPAMASGEQIWAQAWSEPEAGSDLAAVRSRADRVAGGWRLTGQKTWSSRAAFADRGFGLFRSDPAEPRHRGLSYLMFPLRDDRITVRPIRQLDGTTGFAELFFDGLFVPDQDVIGEPGNGWRVAMSATEHERGLTLRSPGRFLATAGRLVEVWRAAPAELRAATRDRVVDGWLAAQAYRLFTYAAASRLAAGGQLGAEASLNKLYWSRLDLMLHETALALLGERAELLESGASWPAGYLFALAGPIYAGTNEIQRDLVAERLLGLPRGR
ncbi:MAG TPA: acyl-CoA dehydrogenase family protein [Natronosporangium sp.]